jgi:hypothetical protein
MISSRNNPENLSDRVDEEFARILGVADPSAIRGFSSEIWERRPVKWVTPDFPIRMTLAEVEALFHDQPFRDTDIRLVKGGEENFNMAAFLDQRGLIRPGQAWAAIAGGATLVLKHFDTRHPATRDVCRRLELLLNHAAIANLYVTPAGHQGLPLHQDFHDVIVCQLAGTKRWQVYERQAIPTENSPPFPEDEAAAGRMVFEHSLQPGEVMYLPRGSHHRASAQQEASVHVTIGIHSKKWGDLLTVLIGQLMESKEIFRRALPFGFLREGWTPSNDPAWIEMLAALHGEDAQLAVDDLRRRLLKWCSVIPMQFTNPRERLVERDQILVRTGIAHLDPANDGKGRLHLPGLVLEVLAEDMEFVKWANRQNRILDQQLGESLSESKVEVLRQMIRNRVFAISQTPPNVAGSMVTKTAAALIAACLVPALGSLFFLSEP